MRRVLRQRLHDSHPVSPRPKDSLGGSAGQVKQPTAAKRTGWSTARPPERVRLERKSTSPLGYFNRTALCQNRLSHVYSVVYQLPKANRK